MKGHVGIEDFAKLDIRVGAVLECEPKDGSKKLLRLTVDFGEEGVRNVLSGIKEWYSPEDLKGHQYAFVINLAPRRMLGEESQGMMLTVDVPTPIPIRVTSNATPGARII